MAEAIDDVFYVTDLDRNALIYLSPGYERIWGRARAELEADLSSFVSTIHPDDQARFMEGKAAQERGEPVVIEYRVVRPDRAIRWVLDRSFPILRDGDGRRSAGVASDITARHEAEVRLRASEARLRGFGEASQDVLWIRDADTLGWTYLTPAFETIYGLSREEVLTGDNFRNWADLILPEDRDAAVANIQRVREGERVSFEYRIRRPTDGEVRWLRNTDFPILDSAGRVESIGGIGADVTAEKEIAERMAVMVAELQHRTRNLIAVVRSIAEHTMVLTGPTPAFQEQFNDRLQALARVQGLLSRSEAEPITIEALIRMELEALGALREAGDRIEIDGPSAPIRHSAVQTLALALHELATNARKYGALANGDGRLSVTWRITEADGAGRRLQLEWVESGASLAVDASPARRGYGRELIERALPYALGAQTQYELRQGGVRCAIDLPLERRERRRRS
jgi:two-component system CheB/CheR fusion protein